MNGSEKNIEEIVILDLRPFLQGSYHAGEIIGTFRFECEYEF